MPKKNPYKNPTVNDNKNLVYTSDKELEDLGKELAELEKNINGNNNAKRQYNYEHIPVEIVEQNIDEFIIPELQEACKILWSKNIFTFMVSNRNDGGCTYIYLSGNLQNENKEIWDKLNKKYPKNFFKGKFRRELKIQIDDTAKMTEKEISDAFVKMVDHFKVQDVPQNYYQNLEDYLIDCGCFIEIPNPEYVEVFSPMPTSGDLEELDKWFTQINCPKTIKVFNKNKMTKSFEKYVIENGDENRTDFKNKRVYRNPYYLKRHLEYIELKNINNINNTL